MAIGRKTGGRKPGSINKKTAEKIEAIAESGVMPLDYMLELMRQPIPEDATVMAKVGMQTLRFEAAKAAAPYVHPKLANIEVGNKDNKPFVIQVSSSDEKLL